MVGYGDCHNSIYVRFGGFRLLLGDIGVMGGI